MIDRRRFVTGMATIAAASAIGCRPGENKPEHEQYTDTGLQQLGRDVAGWTLKAGDRMAQRYPDIQAVANLLQNKIDPRNYIPFVNIPIRFRGDTSDAAFAVTDVPNNEDARRVIARLPAGEGFTMPWLGTTLDATIEVPAKFRIAGGQILAAIKETSQIIDHYDYCLLYLDQAKAAGVSYLVENPQNVATSQREQDIVTAYRLAELEQQITGQRSSLFEYIDTGSHFLSSIYFANWLVDLDKRGLAVPNQDWVTKGNSHAGISQREGLIRQAGNRVVWAQGQRPAIRSPLFLQQMDRRLASGAHKRPTFTK